MIFTITALLLFNVLNSQAQQILDKIDRAAGKVDKAGKTAERTKNTGDKLLSLFGKKKEEKVAKENNTNINIQGITLKTLNDINQKLAGSKTVIGTKIKFNSASSAIAVQHVGSTEELLILLQKIVPDVFSEKNIESLEEGKLTLKIK